MNLTSTLVHRLWSAVVLLVASASCHAGITVFTTQSAFLAAITAPGVDTFAGLPVGVSSASPLHRTAGPYTYTATSTTNFFGVGTAANPALSTNLDTDTITFSGFGGGASAIGGLFFGSDILGTFLNSTVVLTATDSLGATVTQTLPTTPTTFIGFVSTGTLASLVVGLATPGAFVFPTVDDLTIGLRAVSAVPEPETWALLAAGLAVLGFVAGRSRRRDR